MTKQFNEFLPLQLESLENPFQALKGEDQSATAHMKKVITQSVYDAQIPPLPSLEGTLFNLEAVRKTFTETMVKLSEKPEHFDELNLPPVINVHALLESTLDRLKSKPVITTPQFLVPFGEKIPFFSLLQHSYFLNKHFLHEVSTHEEKEFSLVKRKLEKYVHHLTDTLSPSNLLLTNSITLGNASPLSSEDALLEPASQTFPLGKMVATTPGKVVFQNELFQLIQYEPLTAKVAKHPLLIIPPWTHKYYIFDLKPEDSLIRWAVESGLTVFIVSWANPDDRHINMNLGHYILKGAKTALDQVCQITGEVKVNTLGYCTGGILLTGLLCYLKAQNDTRITSATLLTTPLDFSKTDIRRVYRDYQQLTSLEKHQQEKGFLEGHYIAQVLLLLWANDLIWSSDVNDYLLDQAPFPYDMLSWVNDILRLPPKTHLEYLRHIVIENRLIIPGGLSVENTPLDLSTLSVPLFVMAAQDDYLAPWRSAYPKPYTPVSDSLKFVLSNSGHIGSLFKLPNNPNATYWMANSMPPDTDSWFLEAKKHTGSWWLEWRTWLQAYEGKQTQARPIPKFLEPAPGSYTNT